MDHITDPIQVRVPQLLMTPRQAAQALGIGRSTIYELLASGELESVRIGTKPSDPGRRAGPIRRSAPRRQARRRRSHPSPT